MFQELQYSAVLCYGPLILVIGSFIAFAALADKNARRSYLRRLDLRPDDEVDEVTPVVFQEPVKAMTPSGMLVTVMPSETAVVTRAPVVETAAPPPVAAKPDDLKVIEGIGPKISSVLQAAGISTFSQVAAQSPEALRKILDDAGMAAIHDTTTWPEQAALAAAGDWDGLSKLQDDLRGGRRV